MPFSAAVELREPGSAASCRVTAQVTLSLAPYPLALRSAFGTSHSSSSERHNALLSVQLCDLFDGYAEDSGFCGVGEAGMPPRKTGCYELDYPTLRQHMSEWAEALREAAKAPVAEGATQQQKYDPFAVLPAPYYAAIRADLAEGTSAHGLEWCLLAAFRSLDEHLASRPKRPSDAAFLCVAEAALMDVWGKLRKQQLCQMIGTKFDATAAVAAADAPAAVAAAPAIPSLPPHSQPRSFYTLGMDRLETMLSNLDFGLRYTPLIKIKCDADVARTKEVLEAVLRVVAERAPQHGRVSLDANAAWPTPDVAFQFLAMLQSLLSSLPPACRSMIAMVEQPFPLFRACPSYVDAAGYKEQRRMQVVNGSFVPLAEEVLQGWAKVAQAFGEAGLPIYADESICTSADMLALRPILQGVNIKLEKAGGYRAALQLLHDAQSLGVRTWLGSMVGSSLCSSQVAHLLPVAVPDCWGDLDGSLLTSQASDRFEGGMQWTQDGTGAIHMPTLQKDKSGPWGTACTLKKQYQTDEE